LKLLETIRVENGKFQNLEFHQWRVNWSRKKLGLKDILKLRFPPPPKIGVFRCRIIYSKNIEKIEFIRYKNREVQNFSLAFGNIDYSLKYEDRNSIENLKKEFLKKSDDILIIRDRLVTDTSIANISFFDGERWLTPKKPLLKGTTRERLLREGKIFETDIKYQDIQKYSKFALMNAMIGFKMVGLKLVR